MVAPVAIAIGAGLRWAGGAALRWAFAPAAIAGRAVMMPTPAGGRDSALSTSHPTPVNYDDFMLPSDILGRYEPLPEACYVPVDIDAVINDIPPGGSVWDLDLNDYRQPLEMPGNLLESLREQPAGSPSVPNGSTAGWSP